MPKIDELKLIAEELIAKGNLNMIDKAFSENYTAYVGQKKYTGHAFLKQFNTQLRKAIPDIKISKVEVLSQSNNIITWQRTLSGTHQYKLKGIPASNKKIKWYEIVVTKFSEGKIAEEWIASDLAFQMMLQNG